LAAGSPFNENNNKQPKDQDTLSNRSLPWCGRISGQSEQTNKQMNARPKSTIIKVQKIIHGAEGNGIAARVWRPTTGQRKNPGLASGAIEQ